MNETQISELRKSLPEDGQPYYIRLAAEGASSIRNTLGDWGYSAQVDYSASLERINETTGKVSVTYTVDPGKPLILADYNIINEGNMPLRTRERLITSRFPFEKGDTIDRRRLNLGLSRLYGLGIFSTIDVNVVPQNTQADNPLQPANIEIHLTESETRFMGVTFGWGTYELLRGSIRYTDLDLFGTGRTWTSDLLGNFKGYQASTSLRDSILFGPASLLGISASYRYSLEPSFTITEGDASLSFSYDISPYWTLQSSYTYSLSKVTENSGAIAGAENDILGTGRLNLLSQIDTRQSTLLPAKGGFLSTGVTLSSRFLGSERDFLHYTFKGAAYYPLFRGSVFALAFSYETKQILDDIPTLPIQERFFLGGGGSVRSFSQDLLSPTGPEGKPTGGLTAAFASAELRLRIWRQLHLALFTDAGTVQESSFGLTGKIGWAVGTGLRYYLPVGPIRLDLAYNPGPLFADTKRWKINFAVGFSF